MALLRAGQQPEEAAQAVGRARLSLSGAAKADSELRLALDGRPVEAQKAARKGDFLAALVRHGGERAAAERDLGLSRTSSYTWRDDPDYAAAEDAVLAWLKSTGTWPRGRVDDVRLDAAAEALEEGHSLLAAAAAAETAPIVLQGAVARHDRLAQAMAKWQRQPNPHASSKFTEEAAAILRAQWPDETIHRDDIAKQLGIGPATVSLWARRLQLPPRPLGRVRKRVEGYDARFENVLDVLRAEPITISEAARRAGLSPGVVHGWRRRPELRAQIDEARREALSGS